MKASKQHHVKMGIRTKSDTLWVSVVCTIVILCGIEQSCKFCQALSTTSFGISFQNSGGWSTEEWAKYKNDIVSLRELTACHWEKIRFFSANVMTVWSYCTERNVSGDAMTCTLLYHVPNIKTANRGTILSADVNDVDDAGPRIKADIDSFRHRTWNHICWSYSNITGVTKLYYNGNTIFNATITNAPLIEGSDKRARTSFTLGQESDVMDGEFDVTQLFNGEISELNMWNFTLADDYIQDLAQCRKWSKGNIVRWENNLFDIKGAIAYTISNANDFCKEEKRYVIFPQKLNLDVATALCASHGGKIITPKSAEENNKMMQFLQKHSKICMGDDLASRKLAWLGIARNSTACYNIDDRNVLSPIKYGNWKRSVCPPGTACVFLEKDGRWSTSSKGKCAALKLCTVCSITGNPVFTMTGLCMNGKADWNYYLTIDESNKIEHYEGYRSTNIVKANNTWTFTTKQDKGKTEKATRRYIENDVSYPIGRKAWEIHEPGCNIIGHQTKELSLSKCQFGKEFSCNTGQCIEIEGRCNQVIDCTDGSDEEQCALVQVPRSYRRVEPPKTTNQFEPSIIRTSVEIITVDSMDTANMVVGLTLRIRMTWRDSRLRFANLLEGGKNTLQSKMVEK